MAYILLAFGIATILTLTGSRSTYAESPSLLGTVRCVVRTVLSVDCPPSVAPAPAQSSANSSQSKSEAPSQSAPTAPQSTQKTPAKVGGEEVALPDQTIVAYEGIEQVSDARSSSPRIQQGEYIAYFNRYSPYAVAGAQDRQSMPVERTTEGWRLFGAAWYWWVAAGLMIIVAITSVKRMKLRKSSILSGGG